MPKKSFKDYWNTFIDTISGESEERHASKAEELAKQAQDFNEQYSKQALEEQKRQFDITSGQAQQNIDWQKEQAEKNYAMQQDVFAAQQAENALTRQREDNAYQRQVADLKAAGLSPLMASNGASATNIDVGSAPQYDTQAVATAQGSAIQLAQEYAELKNMAQGQYLSRRQEAINQRIGAKMALSQLDKERRLGFQNMILDSINTATNISRARWSNMEAQQAIEYSKELLKWNKDNGFRNRDMWNTIIPIVSKAANKLGISVDTFTNAVSKLPDQLKEILNTSPNKENIIDAAGTKNSSELCENLTSDEMIEGLLLATMNISKKSDAKKLASVYYPKLPQNRKATMTQSQFEDWIVRDGWKTVFGLSFGLWN